MARKPSFPAIECIEPFRWGRTSWIYYDIVMKRRNDILDTEQLKYLSDQLEAAARPRPLSVNIYNRPRSYRVYVKPADSMQTNRFITFTTLAKVLQPSHGYAALGSYLERESTRAYTWLAVKVLGDYRSGSATLLALHRKITYCSCVNLVESDPADSRILRVRIDTSKNAAVDALIRDLLHDGIAFNLFE